MNRRDFIIAVIAFILGIGVTVIWNFNFNKSKKSKKGEKENFCTCSGLQASCQYVDREKIRDMYRSGDLTEFTDLKRDGW